MTKISGKHSQGKRMVMILRGILIFLLIMSSAKTWAAVADYVGIYSGMYQGTDNGFWTGEIQADGNAFMIIWSANLASGVSALGTVNENGQFSAENDSIGFSAEGDIVSQSGVSVLSGKWEWAGDDGDFSGQRHGAIEYQLMAGSYNGTFAGDYSGNWTMCMSADGRLTGQTYNPQYNITENLNGALVSGTTLLAFGGQSMAIYALLDSSATVTTITGDWYRTADQTSGTFQGLKISDNCNSNPGGGGGGGGGGCFITKTGELFFMHRSYRGLQSSLSIVVFLFWLIGCVVYQESKKRKK